MAFKEGLPGFCYLVLSVIGIALAAIIVSTYTTNQITQEGIQHVTAFTFASVILAFSTLGFILGTWAMVVGCIKPKTSEPVIKTTNTCFEVTMDLLTLFTGILILALAAIIVSYGDAVHKSAYQFAAVILAVSSISVAVSVTILSLKVADTCKSRIVA